MHGVRKQRRRWDREEIGGVADADLLPDFGDLVIKNCHVITKDNLLRHHVLDGHGRESAERKSHVRGDWAEDRVDGLGRGGFCSWCHCFSTLFTLLR